MNKPAQIITLEQAKERFDIEQYAPLKSTYSYVDALGLFEGDVECDFFGREFLGSFFGGDERKTKQELLIIKGNVTVKRDFGFGLAGEPNPSVLIIGDLRASSVISGDAFVHVTGDAYVKYAVNGHFSHGALTIDGATHVPYVLNYNHDLSLNYGDETILIDYYSDHEWPRTDFHAGDLVDVCVAEVFDSSDEEIAELDEDEREDLQFDRFAFIELLEQGKPVLKEGAKSRRQ